MKKNSIAAWLATALILAATATATAADTSRVYVKFKSGQKDAGRALVSQAGGKIHHEFDSLNAVATTVPAAALTGIRNNPNVLLVEDDPPRLIRARASTAPLGACLKTPVWSPAFRRFPRDSA